MFSEINVAGLNRPQSYMSIPVSMLSSNSFIGCIGTFELNGARPNLLSMGRKGVTSGCKGNVKFRGRFAIIPKCSLYINTCSFADVQALQFGSVSSLISSLQFFLCLQVLQYQHCINTVTRRALLHDKNLRPGEESICLS